MGFTSGLVQIYSANLATRQYSAEPVAVDGPELRGDRQQQRVLHVRADRQAHLSARWQRWAGCDLCSASYEGYIIRFSGASTASGATGLTANWFTYVGGNNDEWSTRHRHHARQDEDRLCHRRCGWRRPLTPRWSMRWTAHGGSSGAGNRIARRRPARTGHAPRRLSVSFPSSGATE